MSSVLAFKSLTRRSIEVAFYRRVGREDFVVAPMRMEMRPIDPTSVKEEPSLSLPLEMAQDLLQALWNEGLRPADGEGSSGQVAALKNHIVFAERVADKLLSPGTILMERTINEDR